MRISVVHSTVYRYSQPVQLEPHLLRLRPRHDASQNLLCHTLSIAPEPGGRTGCLDQDGNAAEQVWFDKPLTSLSVRSSFEVETLRGNPFDFLLARREIFTLPFVYPEPLGGALAPYLAGGGASGPVHEFARSVAERAGWRTLDFLTALTATLFETCRQETRDSGLPHPPELTLTGRAGSCRDLAVLFCAVCRGLGIPARFVSGYESGADSIEHA